MDQINNILQLDNKLNKLNEFINNHDRKNMVDGIFSYYTKILPSISLKYNHVEIRNSEIHGKGLFATKEIPKDAIITFYPAHAISRGGETFFIDDHQDKESFIFNIEHNKYVKTYGFTYNDSSATIIGNPEWINDTTMLGHMINDASENTFEYIEYDKINNLDVYKKAVIEYYKKGKSKKKL